MNRAYLKGRNLEYRIKRKLEGEGWFVTRSAGSHSVDLVAIKFGYDSMGAVSHWTHKILFVSCKTNQYIPPAERNELIRLASQYGASPVTTVRKNGKWDVELVKE